ncbi:LOW QUALITY PROTEIN: hypothetical protein BT93_A2247 [Corymbia citriodora subsp. variegata]|nr:LOW QUALITY PROTEIN: hypothetical protein BT93_A2247 [Corymbia citriodora subsp. variegata]
MATAADATPPSYHWAKAVKEFDESKMGVKGLSDSGITSIPEFFVHPPHALSDLKLISKTAGSLPVIDLAGLESADHRRVIIDQVKEAARTWGFFQVVNHGVPSPSSMKRFVPAFHDQPRDVKAKYYKREEGRGVMYASNNDLYRAEAASWHDSLQAWMGPEPLPPEELPEVCRREVAAWDGHARGVAEKVMELLSEGLGLERGRFKELTFSESRTFVGHCYPYCPEPDRTMGITPHTDPGIVTVLLQNGIKGLQVKHGGEWVEVSPVDGGLIINVGDFLQIVSNGEYKSVQHRVVANSEKEPRISIVMFFNLSKWRGSGHYGPLPELLSPERPAVYRDFTAQEFLDNFYSKGLDSKSFVEKIEIQN